MRHLPEGVEPLKQARPPGLRLCLTGSASSGFRFTHSYFLVGGRGGCTGRRRDPPPSGLSPGCFCTHHPLCPRPTDHSTAVSTTIQSNTSAAHPSLLPEDLPSENPEYSSLLSAHPEQVAARCEPSTGPRVNRGRPLVFGISSEHPLLDTPALAAVGRTPPLALRCLVALTSHQRVTAPGDWLSLPRHPLWLSW